eukprot:2306967-Rhodomonas_salina.1
MLATRFTAKANKEAAGDMAMAYAEAGATASETLGSLRTVLSLTAEQLQVDKYSGRLQAARMVDVRRSYRVGFFNGVLFASGNLMAG